MSTRQSGAWIGVHVTSFGSGLATCISDDGTFENLYSFFKDDFTYSCHVGKVSLTYQHHALMLVELLLCWEMHCHH